MKTTHVALSLSLLALLTLSACGGGGDGAGVATTSSAQAAANDADLASEPASIESLRKPEANTQSKASAPGATTVNFSGYTWHVRTDYAGPGPNHFNANSVWVDSSGFLHMKLSHTNSQWRAAEVYMDKRLGFGTYQFKIVGHPETMDKNVVLGLFNYPTEDVGGDGTNEIDIEFATWGGQQTQHGNWTIWPAVAGIDPGSKIYDASANSEQSTHRFIWNSKSITFQSMKGLTDTTSGLYKQWKFAPGNATQAIPQSALPVHMNLWLFDGKAPSDGKEVEIVISEFKFTPQS